MKDNTYRTLLYYRLTDVDKNKIIKEHGVADNVYDYRNSDKETFLKEGKDLSGNKIKILLYINKYSYN